VKQIGIYGTIPLVELFRSGSGRRVLQYGRREQAQGCCASMVPDTKFSGLARLKGIQDLQGYLRSGEFTLNRRLRELRRRDVILPVSGKAFDLLLYMVSNPGRPLSKSELLDAVWPETAVEEANLSQNVFLLRKVLGSGNDGPIKTLAGRGYQFAAEVIEIDSAIPQPSQPVTPRPQTDHVAIESIEATQTRIVVYEDIEDDFFWSLPRWMSLTLVGILLLIIGGWFGRRHWEGGRSERAVSAEGGMSARQALAVLGFRNVSSHAEDAWLSTAVAEMLANEMNAGERLRVVPTAEIARAQKDLGVVPGSEDSEKARDGLQKATGADLLIQGSYVVLNQGANPSIRLMIEVEDAHSGKQLKSFVETGTVSNLFSLIDHAGQDLRRDLSDHGSKADDENALAGMSQNSEAMRLYSEGVEQQRRFDSHAARSLFERAVAADPQFAMAHMSLADAWSDIGFVEQASKEAAEAYRLSTNLPKQQKLAIEAGYRATSDNTEDETIRLYQALFTFYPDDPSWVFDLARVQDDAGHYQDSINTLERVRKLPLTLAQEAELDGNEAEAYVFLDDRESHAKAKKLAVAGVELANKQQAPLLRATVIRSQCYALAVVGPNQDAQKACEQARDAFEMVGNLRAVASETNNLANIAEQRGDRKTAEGDYEESERFFHAMGNLNDEIAMLENLALLYIEEGDLGAVTNEATKLIGTTGTSNDLVPRTLGHYYAAQVDLQNGKLQDARRNALSGTAIASKLIDQEGRSDELINMEFLQGDIEVAAGNFAEADKDS
jgi:DNA-binding winged helix-turn-helix (wHTH) protein/tetratricopeptide (TPR) repeat protein